MKKGEPLAFLHANDRARLEPARERFLKAYAIGDAMPERRALIRGIVEE